MCTNSSYAYTFAGGTNSLTLVGAAPTISEPGNTNSQLYFQVPIAGTNGLIKTGGGNAILEGANTYTGPTTVQAGALELGINAAIATIASTGGITVNSFMNNGTTSTW